MSQNEMCAFVATTFAVESMLFRFTSRLVSIRHLCVCVYNYSCFFVLDFILGMEVDCYRRLWWFHFIFGIDSGLFIHAAIENLLREHGMCEAQRHIRKISKRKPHCHSVESEIFVYLLLLLFILPRSLFLSLFFFLNVFYFGRPL